MSKLIDLTNETFGRLKVLRKDESRKTNCGSYWICECECGKIKSIRSSSLRRKEIQSCGCYRAEKVAEIKKEYSKEFMLNRRFGKLTVKERSERKGKSGEVYWICQCDCGNVIEVLGGSLRRKDGNQTVSCGCYHRSMGELKIIELLENAGIEYIDQYSFLDLPKSRYDFAIIENNSVIRLIEFDGEQHFKDVPNWGGLELQKERDNRKDNYALSHNIPLVRIPYWERDNINLEMIMGNEYLVNN